jgi:hypothetical protein
MKRNLYHEKNRQKIVDLFDAIERHAGHMEFWVGHMRGFSIGQCTIDEELDDLVNMVVRVCRLLDHPIKVEGEEWIDDGNNGGIKGQKRVRGKKERYDTEGYKRLP